MVETVLLIDDNISTLYIQKRMLSKHGKFNSVLTFSEANIALDYLRAISLNFIKKPQLILVDLDMPLMNGWEFIEEYNQLAEDVIAHTRLFILTTSNNPTDVEKSKEVKGVSSFIKKPLSKQDLDNILKVYFM